MTTGGLELQGIDGVVERDAFLASVKSTLAERGVDPARLETDLSDYRHSRSDDRGVSVSEIHRGQLHEQMEGEMLDRLLDTYPAKSHSQRVAVRGMRGLARMLGGPDRRRVRKGVMLYGDPGIGKSGLVWGFLLELMNQVHVPRTLIINCAEIDEQARRRLDLVFAAQEARLVVLDDIEKGLDAGGSKWRSAGDRIIKTIIGRGDRTRRQVFVITSNLSPEQHKKHFNGAWNSRLLGLTYPHLVEGEDMRPVAEEKPPYWTGD